MAKGNFIEYVISDDPNKYPNESEQDGYYYRKVTKVETEEQTVTAGTTPIEVIPSEGKLISKVNINPTPTEEKTVIPTTEDLIVAPVEGKQLSQVTVQGDANFLEENIAEGITIWGKTGTHQGGGGAGQYAWKKSVQATVTAYTIYKLTINGNINTLTTEKTKDTGWNLTQFSFNNDIMTGKVSNFPELFNSNRERILVRWANDIQNKDFLIDSGSSSLQVDANIYTSGDGLKCSTSRSVNGLYTGEFKYPTGTEQGFEFIEFVVSDDASAYPDGAVHTDGYYYEKL